MEPVLRAQHLTKIFHHKGQEDFTAVKDISFDLLPGECLGIIGESGSGKSTVANMLTRLTDVTEGTIILQDKDITRLKGTALRETYRKLQMVFQTPGESFDPRRTLGDGIAESMVNAGIKQDEAKNARKSYSCAVGFRRNLQRGIPIR